jgi:hypothetical protein
VELVTDMSMIIICSFTTARNTEPMQERERGQMKAAVSREKATGTERQRYRCRLR